MKQSNSFTYGLIKSLSPSEKAYVKKQIRTSGKHLVLLFDDLNKCESFQKEIFTKENRKKGYINNLSQNKNYLQKRIIDALISYRSKSVLEIEIHNQINEALILIEKKFYKRAKKIIDQCFKKALHIEDYATCYNLVGIIFKAVNNRIYFGLSKDEINNYRASRSFYLTQLNRMDAFGKLNDIYYSDIPKAKKKEVYDKKLKDLNSIEINDLPGEFPFFAKRIFYFSKSKFEQLSGNKEKYVLYNNKLIELYRLNKQFIKHYPSLFLGDAINFLNSLIKINDLQVFFEEQKKIMSLVEVYSKNTYCTDSSLLHVINYFFPLTAYNKGKYFKKALQFAKGYILFIEKNHKELSNYFITVSYIEISLTYIYNQKYEDALNKIGISLDLKNFQTQYITRLLQILAHYSLKNDLLLDHLFQSFINYLKSADKKEQIPNIRKFKMHTKNKTVHLLKNEDFEDFVYIHWDLFEHY